MHVQQRAKREREETEIKSKVAGIFLVNLPLFLFILAAVLFAVFISGPSFSPPSNDVYSSGLAPNAHLLRLSDRGQVTEVLELKDNKWSHFATTFDFNRQKHLLQHHTLQVERCLDAAEDEQEGHECLASYLSVLPHDIVVKALHTGLKEAKDTSVATDVKELAASLRGCIDVSGAWAGALFCLSDLIANIPRAVVQAAVKSAEAHPNFDYSAAKYAGSRDSAAFSSCVHHAQDVAVGTACLSSYLGALPHALSSRAVKLALQLPAPVGKSAKISTQKRAHELAQCMSLARASDGAVYCVSDYLRTLPSSQVKLAWSTANALTGAARTSPATATATAVRDNLPPLKEEKSKTFWERRYVFHTFPRNSVGLHQRNGGGLRIAHTRGRLHANTQT